MKKLPRYTVRPENRPVRRAEDTLAKLTPGSVEWEAARVAYLALLDGRK